MHNKLNIDAAYYDESNSEATGAILRDFEGNFVDASVKYIPHVSSAPMAEAYAMEEGLALAASVGCNRIVAESDSSEVVQACKGEEVWLNDSSAIYADCINLVATGTVSFNHIVKEANKVAHELPRVCFLNKGSCNWVDEPLVYLGQAFEQCNMC
jgi:ribonuclease HI